MTTNWKNYYAIKEMNVYEMRFYYETPYTERRNHYTYTFIGISGFYNTLDLIHDLVKDHVIGRVTSIEVSKASVIC